MITSELADIDNLLNDFHRELADYQESISFDAESFNRTEERLNLLNHLKAKYGGSIEKVLSYKKEKEERLEELEHYEAYRLRLKKGTGDKAAELLSACAKVSAIRKKAAELLSGKITAVLKDLNFLDVKFAIDFQESAPGPEGFDTICFLISMNPGQPLMPLQKVASGGELSRVMLAIKTVLADKDAVGTMIFDEIDVVSAAGPPRRFRKKWQSLPEAVRSSASHIWPRSLPWQIRISASRKRSWIRRRKPSSADFPMRRASRNWQESSAGRRSQRRFVRAPVK